jgi:hypothetical protein
LTAGVRGSGAVLELSPSGLDPGRYALILKLQDARTGKSSESSATDVRRKTKPVQWATFSRLLKNGCGRLVWPFAMRILT